MDILSGYLSGVSGHLDSSHPVEQESTDGARIPEDHINQTEVQTTPSLSSYGLIQIAPTSPDMPQEQDNSNRDIHSRFDALKPPCQTLAPCEFNVVKMTGGSSLEKSEFTTSESLGVVMDQQDLETRQENITECNFFPDKNSMVENAQINASNRALELMLTEGDSGSGLDDCLASATHSSNSDALNTPHSDIVIATGFRASPDTSDFSIFSLNLPLSPDFSHQVDVKTREQVGATLTENFKSTACRSDDILSRSTLKVDLATNTKSDCRGILDIHVNCFLSPLEPNTARAMIAIDSVPKEQDIHTNGCSLAPQDQWLKQSHEETAVSSVSDHLNVALSSPTAQIEYLQSHPYSEPATIIRAYSPYISTEVVGTPNPPSSSPPSSPSMNSHYMPSSSPLPSSSPVDGSSQISPPSSPAHQDAYNQPSMSNSGSQQEFHSDDHYSTFPHYAMEHMYYKPLERAEVEGSYMQPPLDYMGSTSAAITPSYPLGFYNQQAEPTPTILLDDHYNHPNTSSYLPVQVSIESSQPPADNTQYDNTRYDNNAYNPIPISQEYIPPKIAQYETSPVEDEATTFATATTHDHEPAKANVVPRPKRSTVAGQRQQQKKLSKPFRSPVLHAPVRLAPKPPILQLQIPAPIAVSDKSAISQEPRSATAEQSTSPVASSSSQTLDTKSKHRTTRAAAQFKSPLPATSTPLDEATLVRLTPTIQSLERKLQLLRRALKVREDVQEEVLEGLVKKWSEAGREAAWEVWDVVKDNANSEDVQGSSSSKGKGKKRSIDESWGWDESGDQKKPRVEEKERNWGWDVVPVSEREGDDVQPEEDESTVAEHQQEEEGEEGAPQPSLGTMLIQLGIAPETLGWDEEEGNFVDR